MMPGCSGVSKDMRVFCMACLPWWGNFSLLMRMGMSMLSLHGTIESTRNLEPGVIPTLRKTFLRRVLFLYLHPIFQSGLLISKYILSSEL